MAQRKLQAEIDRTLKKVQEGVEMFEGTYDKIQNCSNPSQKEKLEADLKTQIKKLQRMRDQIKTWLQSSEIKDKKALLDARKLIEVQMERFKACEKEMKTKAFSKEGLSAAQKLDPREAAKVELTNWISNMVDELARQIEHSEAELESLQGVVKKKKDSSKADRAEQLETLNERRRWHQGKLEVIQRMLDNGNLDTDSVNEVKEDISYYVESNTEEDFEEDLGIYDMLNLTEEDDMFGAGQDDIQSSHDSVSVADDSTPATIRTPSKEPVSKPLKSAATAPSTVEEEKSPTHPKTKAAPTAPARKSTLDSTTVRPVISPSTKPSGPAAATAPAPTAPAPRAVPAPMPTIRYATAAAAAVASQAPPSTTPVTAATATAPPPASAPPATSSNQPPVPPSTAPTQPAQHAHTPTTTGPPTSGTTSTVPPTPASSISVPLPSTGPSTSPELTKPSTAGGAPTETSSSGGPSVRASPVLTNGAPTSSSSQSQAARASSPAMSSTSSSVQQPNGAGSQQPQQAATSSTVATQHAPPQPQPPQQQQPAIDQQPSSEPLKQQLQQQPQPGRPTSATESRLPSSLADLVTSFESAKHKALHRTDDDLNAIHKILEAGYPNVPQPRDAEKPKYYVPRHPFQTPAYYPQQPLATLESTALFAKYDHDTLFYIFYSFPGTHLQYKAAEELKKRSWRFHKSYLTWFQRASEPQEITDEYEKGIYLYFDCEQSFQVRQKKDFIFEYRFLEE